jgi:hypothetical protein
METLKKYSGIWSRIAPPPSNTFDTRACKAFAKSLRIESEETDQLTGQKCIDFLLKHLDKATVMTLPPLEENQCDNTLLEESKELMLGFITKCFRTDRGVILLENHMMFFQDAHTEEEREAWFKETMEEWKQNLHSEMVEGFQTALRLWMITQ